MLHGYSMQQRSAVSQGRSRPSRLCSGVPRRWRQRRLRAVQVRAAHASNNASGNGPNWNPMQALQRALSLGSNDGGASPTATSAASAAGAAAGAATAAPPASKDGGAAAKDEATEEKSDEYTKDMQNKMGTSLTYRHEDGINWNTIIPDLIVGSCLQTPEDAPKLAKAGVTTVFCLQEDSDLAYFSIDIQGIQEACSEVGIKHVRFPIRDFDPYDLRLKLPKAVAKLASVHDPQQGRVYIHCTAGLGRAPGTALAYMYWLRGWDLEEARQQLTGLRPCSPRIESIRAATADLLSGGDPIPTTISMPHRGHHRQIQVAGLDFGWHKKMDLQENKSTHRMEIVRHLMPGSYPFKFIIDDKWCASVDYPQVRDGANTNNLLTVLPRESENMEQRERLLSPTGLLVEEERQQLASLLCPWPTHTTPTAA